MIKPFAISLLAVSALSACSSVGYQCPLKTAENPRCATMDDTYSAAVKSPKYKGENVLVSEVEMSQDAKDYPMSGNRPANAVRAPDPIGMPQPTDRGMPVYDPPKVFRAWVAPWTDAEGVLHAGSYAYFNTPGKWNYGTLKAEGEASGVFRPVKPDDYGFQLQKIEKNVKSGTPPKATSQTTAPSAQSAAQQGQAAPAQKTPATLNNVTQPYERLN